ncbi:MAG: fibronectin type III domain-containing protein, partial [Actinomycetes bacterium]
QTASSAPSNSVTPAAVPGAPSSLVATPGNGSASIAFTAGASNGAPISNYEYSLDGGNTWSSAGSTDSPLEIDGLDSATQYSVAIRAVNSSGSGASSTVRAATTKKG